MPEDPVAQHLEQTATALRAAAVAPGSDWRRVTAYLHRVDELARRWTAGEPAHTPRAAKAAAEP